VLDRLLRPLSPARGEAPSAYYSTVFDALETLAYVAGLTSRVELGTSVIQALYHSPVVLARRLATIDQLSGGRVIAGLGRGWMPEEFTVAGVPLRRRKRAMPEFLAAMRATWGPDPVRFAGEIYDIPESDIGPKPARAILYCSATTPTSASVWLRAMPTVCTPTARTCRPSRATSSSSARQPSLPVVTSSLYPSRFAAQGG